MIRTFPRPVVLRQPAAADLRALAERSEHQNVTYDTVGISLAAVSEAADVVLAPHWGRVHETLPLGTGPDVWEAAVAALRAWDVHAGAGITMAPSGAPLREGTVVALAVAPRLLPWGALLATCRIVRVIDEPDRVGFAYGTLALHPEQGEGCFLVERDASGAVAVTVCAVSRPVILVGRLVPPLARLVIAVYVGAYVHSWRRAVQRRLPGTGTNSGGNW